MDNWKDNNIKILSYDKVSFDIKLGAAIKSEFIKALLHIEDCDIENNSVDISDSEIEIPPTHDKATSIIISKIIEYCNYITYDNSNFNDFYSKFIEIDHDTLFNIIIVSNYLELKCLLDLTCKSVADEIQ